VARKQQIVGVELAGGAARRRSASATCMVGSIAADHALGDTVLQIEHIAGRTVKAVGPPRCAPDDGNRSIAR